uniref:Uncharacterized protein n=1 Tax=Dunaliella tertiolecta TaxID=3047 RepID=A0A7S3QS20_DUNTE|eukprot:1143104-Pelagomonas_calceolata.AAC.7
MFNTHSRSPVQLILVLKTKTSSSKNTSKLTSDPRGCRALVQLIPVQGHDGEQPFPQNKDLILIEHSKTHLRSQGVPCTGSAHPGPGPQWAIQGHIFGVPPGNTKM